MELFVINRYSGEEEKKEELPDELELKNKLLEKVEERRKRLSCLISEDEESIQRKKKKKQKEKEIELEEQKKEIKKPKKKKKKKAVETNNNLTDDKPEETATSSFLVLGKDHNLKKEKIKRVLPSWLANPSVVSVDLRNLTATVDSITNLEPILVQTLKENNITHFFPVQAQLIPWLLDNMNKPPMYWPSDVCVSAPTGSGKTLAFVLPIVQALCHRIIPRVRALVVLPVQDLAVQVFKVFHTYCTATNLKVILLSNKRNFSEEQKLIAKENEITGFQSLVDIIVTTPGRLVDHLKCTPGLSLEHLVYLVIDEADRVMENIQNDWLYHLYQHIHPEYRGSYQAPLITLNTLTNKKRPPQKLLFSATLSQDPEKLQQLGLFHPKLFTSVVKTKGGANSESQKTGEFIGKFTTPAELEEQYVVCSKATKPLILFHLIKTHSWKNVLCFVNSIESTLRLGILLKTLTKGKTKVGMMSSKLTPVKRNKVLSQFASGEVDVLVCSDALARGIDIPDIKYVVSYDPPQYVKTYVHRIGRTGRAGKEGMSITFLCSNEVNHFKNMLETAGKNSANEVIVSEEELQQYTESYQAALSALKKRLQINKSRARIKVSMKMKKPGRSKFSKSVKTGGKKKLKDTKS